MTSLEVSQTIGHVARLVNDGWRYHDSVTRQPIAVVRADTRDLSRLQNVSASRRSFGHCQGRCNVGAELVPAVRLISSEVGARSDREDARLWVLCGRHVPQFTYQC